MPYVFLIGTYHEYGNEDLRATTERSKTEGLLPENRLRERAQLKQIFELNSDEELAEQCSGTGIELSEGWGGYQLIVAKLE